MMIDTKIRHVTKRGANLFRELGFPPAEADRLHTESQQQINDTKALKEQLMSERRPAAVCAYRLREERAGRPDAGG
jgi:N-acetylglutamate synthase-like GNAT family acetyltransferase